MPRIALGQEQVEALREAIAKARGLTLSVRNADEVRAMLLFWGREVGRAGHVRDVVQHGDRYLVRVDDAFFSALQKAV